VLNLHGTLDYFIENAFNYPTLAEAYKIAALDAWNRLATTNCPDRPTAPRSSAPPLAGRSGPGHAARHGGDDGGVLELASAQASPTHRHCSG
jgi:hypothetical protein